MVSFDALPYEVLANILEYVTSERLAVFARTSRRTYDAVTARLYARLRYVQDHTTDPNSSRCSAALTRASRIVRFKQLLVTLSRSDHLKRRVVSLSLQWGSQGGPENSEVTALLYLLSPTLLHLDISYSGQYTIPVMPKLQSLEQNFRYWPLQKQAFLNLDYVIYLNHFSTLQHLTLWDVYGNWARNLPKILVNFASLRVLRLSTSVRTKNPMLFDYDARLGKLLVNAIAPVKATLEELVFVCFASPGSSRGYIDSLKDFPKLKRVDLPYFWLMWDPYGVQGDLSELKAPQLHNLLPENLQELQIQVPTSLEPAEDDGAIFVGGPTNPEAELIEFGAQQKNLIPSLKLLSFYGLRGSADNDRNRVQLLWFLPKKHDVTETHRKIPGRLQHCTLMLHIVPRPDQVQLDTPWSKALS